ncbi:Pentatricopeptide repeat-containing protein [Apostasia shenzhenica]|uniref:Pentatricopeptide repeat-containing protein n=1 Tax=Apostasia shenzhenica TaxID=1088818 RepID=A0A2I0ADH4_9ASPA|nr:Pentatricopeptide repeat-containing protein [Apostasia shenzhenica]
MASIICSALPNPVSKPSPSSSSYHLSPCSPRLPASFGRRNGLAFPLHSPPSPSGSTAAGGGGCATEWSIEQRIQQSLAICDLMETQYISLDAPILCTILKSCADARSLRLGRAAHEKALRAGLHTDPFVANNLLLLYSRCGLLATARQVFDEMPIRNVVSWTTAIAMYHHAGFPRDALDLYRLMCSDADATIRPNDFTYTIVLNCCASAKDLELGILVHEDIIAAGFQNDRFVNVALIDMYSKCGDVERARKVFDEMPEPPIEACTAMIEGYSGNDQVKKASSLISVTLNSGSGSLAEVVGGLGFTALIRPSILGVALRHGQQIHAHIIRLGHKPGSKHLSALASLYEKCDKVEDAYRLFDELKGKDLGLWRKLMSGFVRNGLNVEAFQAYSEITSLDFGLNLSAEIDALKACVGMMGLREGKQVHGRLVKMEEMMNDTVISGLAELYNSCGEHEEAWKVKNLYGSQQTDVF